jgi:two-component SAPR family response regulator
LLYLACQPSEGVSRAAVVQTLWPEDEVEDEGAHRFRQLRYRLRRQLAADVPGASDVDGVCLDRRRLRLDPGVIHSDAQDFLDHIRSARVNPGPDTIDHLERARALYTGDLLEGPDVRRYAWIDERDASGVTLREHFRTLFQNASIKLAELYASAGSADLAIDVYRELTQMDPADDQVWQALFRLHAQRGDRESLVAEEQRLRRSLRELAEELGELPMAHAEEPSRETTDEFKRLLAGLREREPVTA